MSVKGPSRSSSVEESYANTNFWGIDGYKNSVRRLEDGATLCDEFMKLVNERADIEMKYTLKLREWNKRWCDKISGRISEYGSMLEVFKSALREAEEVAEIHAERHNRLKADLCESIKQWKNQHYHKSVLKWKEVKECETGFTKIYEPWARRYNKMDKSKRNFHRVAKASEHASLLASNAERDGTLPDKVRKLEDQSAKLKTDLDESRKKYERRLSELNALNEKYAGDLETEFSRWDRFEKVRLAFFKDALLRYHGVLDVSENERLTNIYKIFLSKIKGSDAVKDLKWWSAQYGPGMPKKWPEFEEPDAWSLIPRQASKQSLTRRLSLGRRKSRRRNRKRFAEPAKPVDLQDSAGGTSHNPLDETTASSYDDLSPNVSTKSSFDVTRVDAIHEGIHRQNFNRSTNIVDYYDDCWNRCSTFTPTHQEYDPSGTTRSQTTIDGGYTINDNDSVADVPQDEPAVVSTNPFDNDDDEEEFDENAAPEQDPNFGDQYDDADVNGDANDHEEMNDDDIPGVPMRAKYDYEASEPDELSFNCGDIITQLSGEDEQGWCKGRLNGVVGLFPAKWVEAA